MLSKPLLSCLALTITCATAHAITIKNITYATKGGGTVIFDHGAHLKQTAINNNCKACHSAIFDMKKRSHATMADMEKGKSCGACHNGKDSFPLKECVKCHRTKEIKYQVKDAGNVLFSHKSHAGRNTCNDCHAKTFILGKKKKQVTMDEMSKGKSCGACHDGKTAFTVNENCAECHKM